MNDLIDRQDAIDAMKRLWEDDLEAYGVDIPESFDAERANEAIRGLPSAGTEWIPCSERLPDTDELMLVNYIDRRPGAGDIWIGWHEMENVWYINGEAHSEEYGNEVIAWMPLPEPWKGEENE